MGSGNFTIIEMLSKWVIWGVHTGSGQLDDLKNMTRTKNISGWFESSDRFGLCSDRPNRFGLGTGLNHLNFKKPGLIQPLDNNNS